MTTLNQTLNPINAQERVKINQNWDRIMQRFSSLQGQINVLSGETSVEDILTELNSAISNANTTVQGLVDNTNQSIANVNQKITEVDGKLVELQTAIDNANLATDATNSAINDARQAIADINAYFENFRFVGEYNATTTYRNFNFVRYQKSTFVSLKENLGITPNDDGVNWRLVAAGGIDGMGAVVSVNGKNPNSDGEVTLIPTDIGAASSSQINETNNNLSTLQQQVTTHSDNVKDKLTTNHLNAQQISQVRHKAPKPMLVIEYDDGAEAEYTSAFPIHQNYNVPGTLNIVTGLVGKQDASGIQFMTLAQITEMYNAGWEVSNHTARHNNLKSEKLTKNVSSGSRLLYLENSKTYRPDIGGETQGVLIENGIKEVVTFIAVGEDNDGYNMTLLEPLVNSFTTNAIFRLTDEELVKEITGAQETLKSWGFNVKGISYPYGLVSELSRKIVGTTHSVGRGAGKDPSLNNKGINVSISKPFRTFECYSTEFSLLSELEITATLNETVANNGLCIMYAHPYNSNWSESKLIHLIETAQNLGIEIVTRSEAMLHFGNIFEIGDMISEEAKDYPSYFVVGQNGEIYTGSIAAGNGKNLSLFTANGTPYVQGRNADLNISSTNVHDLVFRTGNGEPFGSKETVRLRQQTNDIELTQNGGGILFSSPDGLTKKKLTIDNSGNPIWTNA